MGPNARYMHQVLSREHRLLPAISLEVIAVSVKELHQQAEKRKNGVRLLIVAAYRLFPVRRGCLWPDHVVNDP